MPGNEFCAGIQIKKERLDNTMENANDHRTSAGAA